MPPWDSLAWRNIDPTRRRVVAVAGHPEEPLGFISGRREAACGAPPTAGLLGSIGDVRMHLGHRIGRLDACRDTVRRRSGASPPVE